MGDRDFKPWERKQLQNFSIYSLKNLVILSASRDGKEVFNFPPNS